MTDTYRGELKIVHPRFGALALAFSVAFFGILGSNYYNKAMDFFDLMKRKREIEQARTEEIRLESVRDKAVRISDLDKNGILSEEEQNSMFWILDLYSHRPFNPRHELSDLYLYTREEIERGNKWLLESRRI
jgi:hypothetical protein